MIKNFFKRLISWIVYNSPIKHCIIFESYPELSGSPWMVYQEFLKRGYEKKYKLIWAVDSSFVSPANVQCVPFFGKKTLISVIRRYIYLCSAKIIIDSNRGIEKVNTQTYRLFTRHGGTLKKCDNYLHEIGRVDAVLSLSNEIANIDFQIFSPKIVSNRNQVLELGMPANDLIFKKNKIEEKMFWEKHFNCVEEKRFKKVIGWMPTFRQHRCGIKDVSIEKSFPFGLPLVYTIENFKILNNNLAKYNILLAIQMHHAQQSFFPSNSFSNIVLISPQIKNECQVTNAELMNCFDAMITDYSAAYYEYILLNRPIAISIDDFEDYSKKIGFSIDFFDYIRGHYLKTFDDLLSFVLSISKDVDLYAADRAYSLKKIHKWTDDKSTKRVVDYIEQNVHL